eukprot:gene5125-6234_t
MFFSDFIGEDQFRRPCVLAMQRRHQLQSWLWKILEDTDLSHSSHIRDFLELALARRAKPFPAELDRPGDPPRVVRTDPWGGSNHNSRSRGATLDSFNVQKMSLSEATGANGGWQPELGYDSDESNFSAEASQDSQGSAPPSVGGASSSSGAIFTEDGDAQNALMKIQELNQGEAKSAVDKGKAKVGEPVVEPAGVEAMRTSARERGDSRPSGKLALPVHHHANVRRILETLKRRQQVAGADLEESVTFSQSEVATKDLLAAK